MTLSSKALLGSYRSKPSKDPLREGPQSVPRHQGLLFLHKSLQGVLAARTNLNKNVELNLQRLSFKGLYLLDSGALREGDSLADECAQLDRKSTVNRDKPTDLPRVVQPEPEGFCEPVVERLVRLADVLGEDGDDGHLPHLLHHPGEPAPGPPHQLVHVVPHLGLVGSSRGKPHQVALLK